VTSRSHQQDKQTKQKRKNVEETESACCVFFLASSFCKIDIKLNSSPSSGLEPRTAIAGSFSARGLLGELDRVLGLGVPFFSDTFS
jgi:hypothetical protein